MATDTSKIESPALRLARYLKEFVGLRSTTVRDVAKYESVIWFGDMPQEADCRSGAWTDEYDPEEPWLEVRKQEFKSPPEPPEAIARWVDAKALRKATPELPPLLASIFVEDVEAEVDEGETPPLVERHLSDYPEVVDAYQAFRPKWEAWAADQRRREAVQKVYAELFRLHTQVQKQGEIVELVLGLGLVDWRATLGGRSVPIRRHSVVAQVELSFEPGKGVIRVAAPGEGARLRIEDDMLEAELRPDRSHYAVIAKQLEEVGDAIWDKPLMHAALKTWSGALSANSTWADGLGAKPASGNNPNVSFAPALILRKRLHTGMVRVYEKLIENLGGEDAVVPDGWGRLIDDDWRGDDDSTSNRHEPSQEDSGPTPLSSETYFPLPANREQRRIVDALRRDQGVLVQGPPGTGKSHTIANLICHLLATGKRVLVTAETARALQVLKDKLPKEIQPLCVSLLGQGGDAFAELNGAVQGITNRQSSYSPGAYAPRITEVDRELHEARRRLSEIESEIRSLRQDETVSHSLLDGAYQGTASKIAARVAEERERFGWLRLPQGTADRPPITNRQVTSWLTIRRQYSNEDIESANRQIPESAVLTAPGEFARFVSNETSARRNSPKIDAARHHPAFVPIRALPAADRARLRENLRSIEWQRLSLQRLHAPWLPMALKDAIVGRDAKWTTLLELSKKHLEHTAPLLSLVSPHVLTRPEGVDPRKVRADAAAAVEHLEAGGKWKRFGLTTPKSLKGRTYLKRDVLVNGQAADDVAKLRIVRDLLDFEFALADLLKAWRDVGLTDVPADQRLCLASLKGYAADLESALGFAAACEQAVRYLSRQAIPIPAPTWLDDQVQQWIDLITQADRDEELGEAASQVEACGQTLKDLRQLHNAHPVVEALLGAIAARDVTAYSEGHASVVTIERMREAQTERGKIEAAIKEAIPGLIEEIEATLDDPVWEARLSKWEEAWRWAIADIWLQKRSDLDYQKRLWRARHETEALIGKLIAEAASLRAWTHFFDRLLRPEANALRSWREAVRAMGKGTGTSAKLARLRQDARRYMDACRDAIPIWIMPRYLVAEMIDPSPGRYDLVIVDEASQLGIESLFLFYISKQVIVVGDDQQISPAGVGIADAAVAGLQQHFLDGVPHQHALSPQSSLYGNAKIRFNQNIVLREHFRCMPEIIQFSNDLCYASNGTPLDPLRAYPANRLEPLVLHHVTDGYRKGSTQYAQNPPEAEAIVAQICACIEDPRYAQATMGMISLQGEAQAKLIESMLLATLDPEVIEERRLICGDAYAFQGDERNIIFLSMVAAPGEHRIGVLSGEAARQRFNVAVSRAQDQLWLFHSTELETLSSACMRYRLLSYMLNPQRQATEEREQRFDSEFERHVYRRITDRGFHVRTQVSVGDPTNHRYRIDLVVEGMQGRLAVECDGDEWHGPDRYEQDMSRQRDLERAGWQFARIRGGDFYRDPDTAMEEVWAELDRLGIQPGGVDAEAAQPPQPKSMDLHDRLVAALDEAPVDEPPLPETTEPKPTVTPAAQEASSGPAPVTIPPPATSDSSASPTRNQNLPTTAAPVPALPPGAARYVAFEGHAGPDPRETTITTVAAGLRRIIETEGPVLAKRAYDIYLRGCGVHRMGPELKKSMNRALDRAIRDGAVVKEDESGTGGLLYSVVRLKGAPPVVLRERGPRDFEEIPPSEIQFAANRIAQDQGLELGSDAHFRAVLEYFDLKRLTKQVETRLLDVLTRRYPYVEGILKREEEQ
ncbi:MAG: AAA domain-containing protein [Porticoccaceae bacterium]